MLISLDSNAPPLSGAVSTALLPVEGAVGFHWNVIGERYFKTSSYILFQLAILFFIEACLTHVILFYVFFFIFLFKGIFVNAKQAL